MGVILTCRDMTELLTERDEGTLSGVKRAQLALHLFVCGRCQSYEKQFETTVGLLKKVGSSTPADPPAPSAAALLAQLKAEQKK